MSAKLRVPAGASLQVKGGETSAPSHVYFVGIACPSIQATLVNFIVLSSWAIDEDAAPAIQPVAMNPSRSHGCRFVFIKKLKSLFLGLRRASHHCGWHESRMPSPRDGARRQAPRVLAETTFPQRTDAPASGRLLLVRPRPAPRSPIPNRRTPAQKQAP